MTIIHATCIALGRHGVLLRGDSGSGKSDLALRLIDDGAMLVADDQVEVRIVKGALEARPPQTIAGMMEVRGVGIIRLPYKAPAIVALVVTLVDHKEVPRLPEPESTEIEGMKLPHLLLAPFETSAPAKIRLMLRALGQGTAPA